jgi:hypothetical protein
MRLSSSIGSSSPDCHVIHKRDISHFLADAGRNPP